MSEGRGVSSFFDGIDIREAILTRLKTGLCPDGSYRILYRLFHAVFYGVCDEI